MGVRAGAVCGRGVWGGGLLPEVPTQHPARWNFTLQEPEQSAGGSEGFRMYTHIQPAAPPREARGQGISWRGLAPSWIRPLDTHAHRLRLNLASTSGR